MGKLPPVIQKALAIHAEPGARSMMRSILFF